MSEFNELELSKEDREQLFDPPSANPLNLGDLR